MKQHNLSDARRIFKLIPGFSHGARVSCLLLVLCTISACVSTVNTRNPAYGQRASDGIAVLGVVERKGLSLPFKPSQMTAELTTRLSDRGDLYVLPAAQVSHIIGNEEYKKLLASYSQNGRFTPQQTQLLTSSDLRTRRAVIVRVEHDSTKKLPVENQSVFDENGRRVVDRQQRVFITERTTVLSARMLDLATGRTVWIRQYQISPQTRRLAKEYLGSSMVGSVAAEMANAIVNGIGTTHPQAPSLVRSLRALIGEVALKMPAP